jgi:hypothetical protein
MRILEDLLNGLRRACASFPDGRQWRPDNIEIADAGMASFSLFFMQSESFLAHQRRMEHGRNASNCKTVFGIEKIPSDNHIRDLLDPASPELLEPCFEHTLEQMRQHGGMKDFERLGGRLLMALDGSEYFCSEKRGCTRCLTRKRSNGKTENYRALLAATLVAPGHNRVLPLMPEFITPQDGAKLERHTGSERRMGGRTRTYRYRWVENLPLRVGKDGVPTDGSLSVGWKTTYRGAFVTSLAITPENVAEIGACARARWKIENESFNVLKNHGYHLEHNFGHGKQHLAQQFVLLNLLAFAFHTVCDSVEKLWQESRAVLSTRKDFFTDLHTITAYLLFSDWRALCSALIQGNAPSP